MMQQQMNLMEAITAKHSFSAQPPSTVSQSVDHTIRRITEFLFDLEANVTFDPGINDIRTFLLLIYQNKMMLGRCGCYFESWDPLSMSAKPISFSRKIQGISHLLIQ